MTFRDTVRADLKAHTGHTSFGRLVSALLFNPGFDTIFRHRLASRLAKGRLRRLGIMVWRRNILRSGCHIHLSSHIAPGVFLPHPVGIVIGEGVCIGAGSTIYQAVTIGKTAAPSYPVVGENVTLYPNAMVIGPIAIGNGATVGAGAVVLKDVPEGATVVGNPAKILVRTVEQVH